MKHEDKIPFTASAKVLESMVVDYFNKQDPMKMSMEDLVQEIDSITDAGNRILSIGLQTYARVEYLSGMLQARNSLVSSMSDGIRSVKQA